MDDPRHSPLTEDQIAAVADRAMTTGPGPAPTTRAAARLAAVLSEMRTPIEPAPEHLLRRLISLHPSTGPVAGALDRAADAVAGAVAGALRSFLATLTFDSRITPALAGFRGTAGATQLAFNSEAGEIHLQVTESTSAADARVTVRGVLEPAPGIAGSPGRVILTPAQGAPVAGEIDEDLMFSVRIAPGRYGIAIEVGDCRIDLGSLELP